MRHLIPDAIGVALCGDPYGGFERSGFGGIFAFKNDDKNVWFFQIKAAKGYLVGHHGKEMENRFDKITQLWVKSTGIRIDQKEYQWLMGPIGDTDIIGDKFISKLARESNLKIESNQLDFGLLENITDLGLTREEKSLLNPEVANFYERTYNYEFEVWSHWKGIFRPFGWILSSIFSKRLQQLNLPLNPLDSAKGLESNIIKLKNGNETIRTIWFRRLKSNNDVIYSGVYTTCQIPNTVLPSLKVIFPLPNGSANVIMSKKVEKDGSLILSSDGSKFGENGFYFTLTDGKGKFWAKYVKAMHEWIKVYVDDEGILRADHNLNFIGIRFLNLHYKMIKKTVPDKTLS